VRGLETRVAGELHHLWFTEPFAEPMADGGTPQVVEFAVGDAGSPEDRDKNRAKASDNLQPCSPYVQSPLARRF
jgi:hypothetical protein